MPLGLGNLRCSANSTPVKRLHTAWRGLRRPCKDPPSPRQPFQRPSHGERQRQAPHHHTYPRFPIRLSQPEQIPRSLRRNGLPVELINGSLLMRHEHLACALVELMEIGKTSSGANGVLHHPPEAFDGVEVVPTMGG